MKSLLLVSGSTRGGSVNAAVLATVAAEVGREARTARHRGIGGLPHFNPDLDRDPVPTPVAELRNAIDSATAVLFSTPEYAGTMPGALKNLLEWTIGATVLSGKPVGWVNPSTAPARAAGTYAALRTVLGYTGAELVPGALADIPVPRSAIGPDGTVADAALRAGLGDVARRLLAAA
ncbi:NADPH-dependent FMN reductase [Streptomyces spiramenti]|uniref:NAD(P)H-dependent oxidoreductase n=1 Tax=Streptomyces spiramenti TaxID=2720606 RepID=A0ABX1AN43_9ACTN|nr:NADPH-dependent FMN reductase [Streptomyces spiramenti]NJP68513.1 NAD(P)H-dependent oxidoreductase [Streptomyces spiramenti]